MRNTNSLQSIIDSAMRTVADRNKMSVDELKAAIKAEQADPDLPEAIREGLEALGFTVHELTEEGPVASEPGSSDDVLRKLAAISGDIFGNSFSAGTEDPDKLPGALHTLFDSLSEDESDDDTVSITLTLTGVGSKLFGGFVNSRLTNMAEMFKKLNPDALVNISTTSDVYI